MQSASRSDTCGWISELFLPGCVDAQVVHAEAHELALFATPLRRGVHFELVTMTSIHSQVSNLEISRFEVNKTHG